MSPKYEDDDCGGSLNGYIQKGVIICDVKNTSGNTQFYRQSEEQMRQVKFISYFRNDIQPGDEILFGNWFHKVEFADNIDNKSVWMVLETVRGESPVDQVDIVNELMIYDLNGNVVHDLYGEAVTEPYNDPVKDNNQENIEDLSGNTVFTPEESTTGI